MQLNNNLSTKVSGFSGSGYSAVTGLAYDATNQKLGLKVGADTVIPFSNASKITISGNIHSNVWKGDETQILTNFSPGFNVVIDIKNKSVISKVAGGDSPYIWDTVSKIRVTGIDITSIVVE